MPSLGGENAVSLLDARQAEIEQLTKFQIRVKNNRETRF